MARMQIRISGRMLFTWFMLTGFILLLAPQKLTNKCQLAFAHIFRWPLSIGRGVSLSARSPQPFTEFVPRREYNKLQNHLANLEAQLRQQHQKLEKLSKLRNRFALEGAKVVLADVTTATINELHSQLIIDRGKDDGLDSGQFVLGDNGIIGRISEVSSRTALVRLITDPTSKIAVKMAGLNVNRLMQGAGSNSAGIPYLDIRHKVEIGNVVYADKEPGFLDAPMVIGKVAQCKRGNENPSVWDITIEPVCDIEGLKDVAVIIMNPQE